ncbi:DNA-3-methyladenine glycosylase family protein [Foetidibacter luteolus]|uniref:DNA-3-methyladenine glycosylase family protein n=1 Tax=Foetidibacter luteolus TaxID=2608880 RepID=UPI00129ABB4F|nr:DNA-3-methyladenine glycosylase [Foetidibacter luteolus]
MNSFNEDNFSTLCDKLARRDKDLKRIIQTYGYPPFWSRTISFATLIHIILEQQVSLASAKAAFLKLQEKIGHITAERIMLLTDEELKACYFSRQKIQYARHLAFAVTTGSLVIESLPGKTDDEVRTELKKIKGIGDWTADVFLMMVLHRNDFFPPGDIALIKSAKEVKGLPPETTRETVLQAAEKWKPYRTIAAYLLWHAYIRKRNIKL